MNEEFKSLYKKVDKILEGNPATRNSDKTLYVDVLKKYYPFAIAKSKGRLFIKVEAIYDVPSPQDVSRHRRTIQNSEKRYAPTDEKIAIARGWLREEWLEHLGYHVQKDTGQLLFTEEMNTLDMKRGCLV